MTNTAAMAEGKTLNSSDGVFTLRKRLITLMSDKPGEEMLQRKCPRSRSGTRKKRKGGGGGCFVTSAFCKSTLRELGPLTGL